MLFLLLFLVTMALLPPYAGRVEYLGCVLATPVVVLFVYTGIPVLTPSTSPECPEERAEVLLYCLGLWHCSVGLGYGFCKIRGCASITFTSSLSMYSSRSPTYLSLSRNFALLSSIILIRACNTERHYKKIASEMPVLHNLGK